MEEKNTRLYEEIVSQLLERIRQGILKPGDRLPSERQLAEELGVSRTAVREALRSLTMMGCVESHVGDGTFIKAPRLSDLVDPFSVLMTQDHKLNEEMIEARLILETEIAALAARRRSPDQLAALWQTLGAMEADLATGGLGLEADESFHTLLAQAAGNEALRTILSMCAGLLSRTRPLTQALKGVPQWTLKDHGAIYQAVQDQDEGKARRAMRQHLARAQRNLRKLR